MLPFTTGAKLEGCEDWIITETLAVKLDCVTKCDYGGLEFSRSPKIKPVFDWLKDNAHYFNMQCDIDEQAGRNVITTIKVKGTKIDIIQLSKPKHYLALRHDISQSLQKAGFKLMLRDHDWQKVGNSGRSLYTGYILGGYNDYDIVRGKFDIALTPFRTTQLNKAVEDYFNSFTDEEVIEEITKNSVRYNIFNLYFKEQGIEYPYKHITDYFIKIHSVEELRQIIKDNN